MLEVCGLVVFVGCGNVFFFFFNDTATTEIYTLSLHDALPSSRWIAGRAVTTTRASSVTIRNATDVSARVQARAERLIARPPLDKAVTLDLRLYESQVI